MVKINKNNNDPESSVGVADPIRSKQVTSSVSPRKKQYKGVRMRSWGSWVSEIRAPNQKTRIWLGSYATPEAAARAYDAALLCLKGSSASLNFPISTSMINLPDDALLSPKSIQRVAAAAAANATHPITPSPPPTPPPQSTSCSSSSSWSSDNYEEIFTPESYFSCGTYEEPLPPQPQLPNPWMEFDELQSPKYDQMLTGCSLFAPPPAPTIDEFDEEGGDIRLWSFC
ncbi:ethylene-responsive transcription factor ERF014-like [Aristolochia californica]|uniref:ethylene-responsive transcription factor ERF014-like n=1 Tax=Aristolochia californica TaxID=171875 RepID=UPI0035D87FD0